MTPSPTGYIPSMPATSIILIVLLVIILLLLF